MNPSMVTEIKKKVLLGAEIFMFFIPGGGGWGIQPPPQPHTDIKKNIKHFHHAYFRIGDYLRETKLHEKGISW